MEYRELAGPPHSAIERIWFARGSRGESETILPDGRFELIFNFGDAVLQDGEAQPRAMLAAETRRAVSIVPSGCVDFVGVRFRDGFAASVLRTPPRLLRDRMIEIRAVNPRLDLFEQLADVVGDDARAEMIVRHFGATESDPLAAHASTLIRRAAGRVSMTRLANSCGVTIRTLSRVFDRSFGLTPKTFARVTRLGYAASRLRAGERAADVAALAGFADQAHMTNEFRMMARLSPARWSELAGSLAVRFLQDAPPLSS